MAAGVHEPVSRPPLQTGKPNREPGVRRIGAGGLRCRPWPLLELFDVGFFVLSASRWLVRALSTRPFRRLLRANGLFTIVVIASNTVFSQPKTTGHRPITTKSGTKEVGVSVKTSRRDVYRRYVQPFFTGVTCRRVGIFRRICCNRLPSSLDGANEWNAYQ